MRFILLPYTELSVASFICSILLFRTPDSIIYLTYDLNMPCLPGYALPLRICLASLNIPYLSERALSS